MNCSRIYLSLYNGVAVVLWSLTGVSGLLALYSRSADYYSSVLPWIAWAQSIAVLEVIHAMTGLVRSPWTTTAVQVASRLFILWLIAVPNAAVHSHIGFMLATISWTAVEIPRYLFYLWTLVFKDSRPPYFLLWMRYSLFIFLYPSGITGEILCVWAALPNIRDSQMWSLQMPNRVNFAFSWYVAVCIVLILYVPGSPFMYLHMVRQRKKNLGKKPKEKSS